MRKLQHILLYVALLLPCVAARGNTSTSTAGGKAGGSVDVPEIIFEHLGDSYEWHIAKGCVIPLPCIVIGEGGVVAFMSSEVAHGGECRGYHIATEGTHEGKLVDAAGNRPFDISITKNVAELFIVCIVLCAVILGLARWYRRHGYKTAPGGFVGAMEAVIGFVQGDVIEPSLGHVVEHSEIAERLEFSETSEISESSEHSRKSKSFDRFSYYLLTIFFFILTANLMGLLPVFPGGANLTGNIAVTATLAVTSWIAINFFAPKEYYKSILWPDVPLFLKAFPLMPVIEFVGVFTKPFSLTIRLFANILAGHIVILSLTCLIFISQPMGALLNGGLTVVGVAFSLFMNCLELLVAFLQAYVFTMLTATFIGMAHNE